MQGMEEQLKGYVNANDLKSMLDKMITNLLQDQPADIPRYMVEYLTKTYDLGAIESVRRMSQASSMGLKSTLEEKLEIEDDEEDSEDEEDDFEFAELPELKANKPRNRRVSVSASSDMNYGTRKIKKKFFPKTEQEKEDVLRLLKMVHILQGLSKKQLNSLVDATEKFSVVAETAILTEGDRNADFYYIISSGDAVASKGGEDVYTYQGEG